MSSTTQDDVRSWSGYDACRAANNMLIGLLYSCSAATLKMVIVGRPEVAKSTLLNKIVHSDRVSTGPDWRRG